MTYIIIAGILAFLLFFFFVVVLPSEEPSHTYNAGFGRERDFVSIYNKGFAITGRRAMTKHLSHSNAAIFGPTGSGKSSTVIIGSIISLSRGKSSMVIHDVSGELWKYCSGFLSRRGYDVLSVNFNNPEESESFNPLLHCRTISDIQKLSLLVIRNSIGQSSNDPFWENSAMMFMSLIIRYLIFHQEPKYRTMQNVLRMVEQFAIDEKEQKADRLFLKTGDEDLIRAYKTTLVIPDKTKQSIIATLRTALSLWLDKSVCQTTATNSIDFEDLRLRPVAIFLNTPITDLDYYKPISALFIQSLFNFVLSKLPEGRKTRSIFFILDEFAIFNFPAINTTISNIRKYDAGMLLCMQDEMALISNYGSAIAHQIKTNCNTKVYLKGQPHDTCKELSQILGKYTYKVKDTGAEKVRELMTPDEIRRSNGAIILIGNEWPLHCRMIAHYESFWMRRLTKRPQLIPDCKAVLDPPKLNFDYETR